MTALHDATSCKAHEIHPPFFPWLRFNFENAPQGVYSVLTVRRASVRTQ